MNYTMAYKSDMENGKAVSGAYGMNGLPVSQRSQALWFAPVSAWSVPAYPPHWAEARIYLA